MFSLSLRSHSSAALSQILASFFFFLQNQEFSKNRGGMACEALGPFCAMPAGVILIASATVPVRSIGKGPDQNQSPGPPHWGLGVRLTTSPCKKESVTETPTRILQTVGYQGPSKTSRAELTSGSWNNRITGSCCFCCCFLHGKFAVRSMFAPSFTLQVDSFMFVNIKLDALKIMRDVVA